MFCKTHIHHITHWQLLIFIHNPCSTLYILPNVLEVWIFPCGWTPFQDSKDTDEQLSGVPSYSGKVGLTSDSSQNQRECNQRMPDQDCTDGWVTSHTVFSISPRSDQQCEASYWRMTVLLWSLSRNERLKLSTVGHHEQNLWLSQVTEIKSRCTPLHPRRWCL
jgi:hypothetical protein